jgi:hypothetical protein
MELKWNNETETNFNLLIGKIPAVMQHLARDKVMKKLEAIMDKDGRNEITEKDMVDAFFAATPFGFHGPLKCDMEEFGIDYVKYGYDK